MKLIKNNQGQGFMEVIVAIAVMLIGIVAVLILTSFNLTAANYGEKRLIASNLAREALEAVRNMRDSNWLAGAAWDNGFIFDQSGDPHFYTVNFTPSVTGGAYTLAAVESELANCGDDCKLYYTTTIISHDSNGTDSGFSRNIEVRDICEDNLDEVEDICDINERVGLAVTAKVQWQANNGDMRRVVIEDRLFAWR
jgi:Tfp pilus assembly protein PilV